MLDIDAFDFCKVVDVLVKAMVDLPPRLKTHLIWIKERMIESLAWLPGSSIYPLITATALDLMDVASRYDSDCAGNAFFGNTNQPIPGLSLEIRSPASAFKVVASSSRTGLSLLESFS